MDEVRIINLRFDFFKSMVIDFVLPDGEEVRATMEDEIISTECKIFKFY